MLPPQILGQGQQHEGQEEQRSGEPVEDAQQDGRPEPHEDRPGQGPQRAHGHEEGRRVQVGALLADRRGLVGVVQGRRPVGTGVLPGPEPIWLERLGQGRHEHDDQDGDEQSPERQHAPEVGGPALRLGQVRVHGQLAARPALYSVSGATPWPEHERPPQQTVVARAEAGLVVHEADVHGDGTQLRVRQRCVRVAALADGHHATALTVRHQLHGRVAEDHAHHLVHRVGLAGAQVIGEVGVDGVDAGAALQLGGQDLGDVGLVPMAEGVRLADLGDAAALPDRRPPP